MTAAAGEMTALIGRADSMERVAAMFREFDGALKRFLRRRVRCPDDADDLAQDVYLRMSRHPDLARVDCLKAFAYQTALNLVRDRSRRLHTRSGSNTVSIDSIELAGGEDPLDHALNDERLEQVDRALATMSPRCRDALLMHRFGDVTYADIAHCLGVSVSMVEKYISAALVQLRDAESPGAAPIPVRMSTQGVAVWPRLSRPGTMRPMRKSPASRPVSGSCSPPGSPSI